jgi:hypothetical protein
VKKIAKIRSSLKGFSTAASGSKLIIPTKFDQHFFVVVIELLGTMSLEFCDNVKCFNSLRHSVRISKLHPAQSSISDFLADFHQFILNFILHDQPDQVTAPSNSIHLHPCPCQSNCVDCGLFAVAVVLHIIDGVEVDDAIFNQACITQLRSESTSHLSTVTSLWKYRLPSSVIRKWFSQVKTLDVENDIISTIVIPAAASFPPTTAAPKNQMHSPQILSSYTNVSNANKRLNESRSLSGIMNSLSCLQTFVDIHDTTTIIPTTSSPGGAARMATRQQTNSMRTRQTPLLPSPGQQIITTSIASVGSVEDVSSSTNHARRSMTCRMGNMTI